MALASSVTAATKGGGRTIDENAALETSSAPIGSSKAFSVDGFFLPRGPNSQVSCAAKRISARGNWAGWTGDGNLAKTTGIHPGELRPSETTIELNPG
jgi:hypothetical protein